MRKLLLLTFVVTLAHAFLLWAVPARTALFSGRQEGLMAQAQASSFVTRTIAPPAADAASVHAPASVPPKRLAIKPPAPKPTLAAAPPAPAKAVTTAVPAVLAVTPTPAPAPLQIAAATTDTNASADSGSTASANSNSNARAKPEPLAQAKSPPPAVATAGSNAARPPKPVVPPAARLIYDGKGEEKGFLKYTAGGELVWAPDGTQYNAKLEITFLMARLRTWTSKGELGDAGLQPTRFGDKPRGAEQATHFQRDKGIISFSANNPDVPLQPGAQDKLSALLQLSAIVAGAPARYGAGSSISFQAADAHRAELWDFKVSGSESLELPGGNLNGLKLTKEPTVEFDQRIEVWLAPEQNYLPVRLRITEANGAFVDLLWRKTQKPE